MTTQAHSPPHAPQGGFLRQLLGPFYVTGVFWYRFHRWGVSILPGWAVRFFVALFTTFFYVALRRIRRAIAGNLEAVLGPASWWRREARIYRTMWNFAWCLTERYERLGTDRPMEGRLEGEELWRDRQECPDGFVLVTAHMGHWEVGSMLPEASRQRHLHVVREEEMEPEAQEFLRRLIEEQAGEHLTVHFARDQNPALASRLLNALRRGEVVALQGDRPRTGSRTVTATLFGRPFELPLGPLALARAAGVELQPIFVFRERRHRALVVIRPPIAVGTGPEAETDLRRAAEALAREIEWAIRGRPFQWYCFRELWPESS